MSDTDNNHDNDHHDTHPADIELIEPSGHGEHDWLPPDTAVRKRIGVTEVSPELLTYRTVGSSGAIKRRPSIGQLLYGAVAVKRTDEEEQPQEDAVDPDVGRIFGMWDGVLARCLLNIFGVIMFLRLGFCMGIAGAYWGTVVIVIATVIVLLTTLSLSAICTNGEVQGGGAYFMISRALGPQFGGAIGVLFTCANAVAVALYLVGFSESLIGQIHVDNPDWYVTNYEWDLRIWSLIALVVIMVVCLNGIGWVIKIQLALLGLLVVCIITVIIGIFVVDAKEDQGFTGMSSTTLSNNLDPNWEEGSFFFVFSIFFPAVTGIMAGANISGEIRQPHIAIPKGTIMAIIISSITYILLGWLMAASIERGGGDVPGLITEPLVMTEVALWGPLIYMGIYAATLSSAIASLVGAPRILQAVAKDNLFPVLEPFGRGVGVNQEPMNGYVLTFIVAVLCILAGDLNAIAPIISGFFIISYAFVNLACFMASYTNTPGWRPSFEYYNKWVALGTAIACFGVLFLLNVVMGFVTVMVAAALYKWLDYKDPNVSWGSALEAQKYKSAVDSLEKLERVRQHIKNYRPQVLVLTGAPEDRLGLVMFARYWVKSKGMTIFGEVVEANFEDFKDPYTRDALDYYNRRRDVSPLRSLMTPDGRILKTRRSFYEVTMAPTFLEGARSLLQLSGLSKMQCNVTLLGFKNEWYTASRNDLEQYVDTIRYAFFFRYGVMVLRGHALVAETETRLVLEKKKVVASRDETLRAEVVMDPDLEESIVMAPRGSFDEITMKQPSLVAPHPSRETSKLEQQFSTSVLPAFPAPGRAASIGDTTSSQPDDVSSTRREMGLNVDIVEERTPTSQATSPTPLSPTNPNLPVGVYRGTIDVWWLFDDGGLTMLMPHLIQLHEMWKFCTLRVMSVTPVMNGQYHNVMKGVREMASLIQKFRIKADLVPVQMDIKENGKIEHVEEAYVEKFKKLHEEGGEKAEITERTRRHLKMAELIRGESSEAQLIVLTLPVPEVSLSPVTYMAWMDCLSMDLPPVLFIRGNHENVLTFDL